MGEKLKKWFKGKNKQTIGLVIYLIGFAFIIDGTFELGCSIYEED